jgi:hypothetical protein
VQRNLALLFLGAVAVGAVFGEKGFDLSFEPVGRDRVGRPAGEKGEARGREGVSDLRATVHHSIL